MTYRKLLPVTSYLQSMAAFSTAEIRMIQNALHVQTLHKMEWLIEQEQQSDRIYFLNSGMIRTVVGSEDKELTIWVTLPNHFLSAAYSYIKHQPSIIGLQAISRSELVYINRGELQLLFEQIPVLRNVAIFVMNDYYIELEQLYIFCLSQSARQRYDHLYHHFPEHFLKVPLKYLASMIHVKPETLSRIRRLNSKPGSEPLSHVG
ncbi:MAG: Crp/Fnr family transcriptional regulator [Pedobacter sp.]|nr:MAG: Crp/Fnr family transcriptional regulator [Pedobacter sp.]